jgi:hypothetical protein
MLYDLRVATDGEAKESISVLVLTKSWNQSKLLSRAVELVMNSGRWPTDFLQVAFGGVDSSPLTRFQFQFFASGESSIFAILFSGIHIMQDWFLSRFVSSLKWPGAKIEESG